MKKKVLIQKLENKTTKTLLLVRHAKSDWTTKCPDFDRPLNHRGESDLIVMGNQLSQLDLKIELILTSPAKRTLLTAESIAKSIGYPTKNILKEPSIYEGSFYNLNTIIEQLNNDLSTVLIVGHNPTFTTLVEYYSGSAIGNLPTLGVAIITFDITEWGAISSNAGTLNQFIYPKQFG